VTAARSRPPPQVSDLVSVPIAGSGRCGCETLHMAHRADLPWHPFPAFIGKKNGRTSPGLFFNALCLTLRAECKAVWVASCIRARPAL
jgi:hypothetical protein